jgi:hypothetical protein
MVVSSLRLLTAKLLFIRFPILFLYQFELKPALTFKTNKNENNDLQTIGRSM